MSIFSHSLRDSWQLINTFPFPCSLYIFLLLILHGYDSSIYYEYAHFQVIFPFTHYFLLSSAIDSFLSPVLIPLIPSFISSAISCSSSSASPFFNIIVLPSVPSLVWSLLSSRFFSLSQFPLYVSLYLLLLYFYHHSFFPDIILLSS